MTEKPLTADQLEKIATTLAEAAKAAGARGVIVAVSSESEGHSNYAIIHRGTCIEVEGLGQRILDCVSKLWEGKLTWRRTP